MALYLITSTHSRLVATVYLFISTRFGSGSDPRFLVLRGLCCPVAHACVACFVTVSGFSSSSELLLRRLLRDSFVVGPVSALPGR